MDQYLEVKTALENWRKIVKNYQKADKTKAWIQIMNSFLPFLAIWVLMYFSLDYSYWITLALGFLNAFFVVRIFIIQHDCGHQSFFGSRKVNNAIGFVCSFVSSIPYEYWARTHKYHHGHCGQLDHEDREIGDIHYLTVQEYQELSKTQKFLYRLYRNPFVIFVLGPLMYLAYNLRFPLVSFQGWKKTHRKQMFNNLLLAVLYVGLGFLLGWKAFLMVQIPIIVFFGIIAIWFFYVQHQNERTYKAWKDEWDFLLAGIKGSTFYKLPQFVNWLTGNIGYHHIHHLSSRIPNYNLVKCAKENPILQKYVVTIGFFESLKSMFYTLWDEDGQRMITFRQYQKLKLARA